MALSFKNFKKIRKAIKVMLAFFSILCVALWMVYQTFPLYGISLCLSMLLSLIWICDSDYDYDYDLIGEKKSHKPLFMQVWDMYCASLCACANLLHIIDLQCSSSFVASLITWLPLCVVALLALPSYFVIHSEKHVMYAMHISSDVKFYLIALLAAIPPLRESIVTDLSSYFGLRPIILDIIYMAVLGLMVSKYRWDTKKSLVYRYILNYYDVLHHQDFFPPEENQQIFNDHDISQDQYVGSEANQQDQFWNENPQAQSLNQNQSALY